MPEYKSNVAQLDPVWQRIRAEAHDVVRDEPLMGGVMHNNLLHHATMESALAFRFALKLKSAEISEQILREIGDDAYQSDPWLGEAARADMMAVNDRDPACHRYLQP